MDKLVKSKSSVANSQMDKFVDVQVWKKCPYLKMSIPIAHLQSYTSTAIADITRNSLPGTEIAAPSSHIAEPRTDIDTPSAGIATLSTDGTASSAKYHRIKWWVFHDVSQCFTSIS